MRLIPTFECGQMRTNPDMNADMKNRRALILIDINADKSGHECGHRIKKANEYTKL